MKLSEIFGWEKELIDRLLRGEKNNYSKGFNTALTSCDREIDREALAKALYNKICHAMSWENVDYATHTMYIEFADHLISTMPTWLKSIESGSKCERE